MLSLLILGSAMAMGAAGQEVLLEACDVASIVDPVETTDLRLLMRFEIPEELSSAIIELAVVEFEAGVQADAAGGGLALSAFPLTSNWSPASADWASGWENAGGDFDRGTHAASVARPSDAALIRLDVTDFVGLWAASPESNVGLIVTKPDGEAGQFSPACTEGSRTGQPVLRIWYTRCDRVENEDGRQASTRPPQRRPRR